jgi:hypothetical protein
LTAYADGYSDAPSMTWHFLGMMFDNARSSTRFVIRAQQALVD